MVFDNVAALIEMGGHGVYVWTAYGVSAAVMIALILYPIVQYRKKMQHLAQQSQHDSPR